ncbi:nicotinate-nucleotide adenylyltransferase [Paenibacillus sp. y28]|uniref:nicotinate-nucleotide adenylyltransferase n=1 Tax=Paenibacillus sp. y28 TaxID=3129110 RepID=UPI0030182F65
MKVGIMGGTFDPIHTGHLLAAEWAREEAGLEEVWFMPAGVPPHKPNAPKASADERLALVQAAIAGHDSFRICGIELEREGPSYTADTMEELVQRHPGVQFSYIIGADMVQFLPHWNRIERLAELITFVGLQRPGYPLELEELPEAIGRRVQLVPFIGLELSSTEIRRRLASGRSVRYMVPEPVYTLIREKGLYGS